MATRLGGQSGFCETLSKAHIQTKSIASKMSFFSVILQYWMWDPGHRYAMYHHTTRSYTYSLNLQSEGINHNPAPQQVEGGPHTIKNKVLI